MNSRRPVLTAVAGFPYSVKFAAGNSEFGVTTNCKGPLLAERAVHSDRRACRCRHARNVSLKSWRSS